MKITFSLIFILSSLFLKGQIANDTIMLKKNGRMIYQNKKINFPKAEKIFSVNPEALNEFHKAKKNYQIAAGWGFLGGVLLGVEGGKLLYGKKMRGEDWVFLGLGLGITVATFPLNYSYKKHIRKAVSIYNSQIPKAK